MKLFLFALTFAGLCFDFASAQTYSFTVLAGSPGKSGSTDGIGPDARFFGPNSLALDQGGNIFVCDTGNATIRKVASSGVVSTIAGLARVVGNLSGTGNSARFIEPCGIAIDSDNNLLVADAGTHSIRKITSNSVVTTLVGAVFDTAAGVAVDPLGNIYVLDADFDYYASNGDSVVIKLSPSGSGSTFAGTIGQYGSTDGIGPSARFGYWLEGIATDRAGNIFVSDYSNAIIRKINPAGSVFTLAGTAGITGTADGKGAAARFYGPGGLTVDDSGNVFVADNRGGTIRRISADGVVTTIRDSTGAIARFNSPAAVATDQAGHLFVIAEHAIYKGTLSENLIFATGPRSQVISPGGTAIFSAVAVGENISYQWMKGDVALVGETNPALVIRSASGSDVGTYRCVVSNPTGSIISAAASLSLSDTGAPGRLVNYSSFGPAGADLQTFNLGITLSGPASTTLPILVRGVGPSLASLDVSGFLTDPTLDLYTNSTKFATNDNWSGDPQISAVGTQVGAFPLIASNSKDAALFLPALTTGSYSVVLSGVGGATGAALLEFYDASSLGSPPAASAFLSNIAARAQITYNGMLTAGFVIGGQTSRTVLIRAVGPTLNLLNVARPLPDPTLAVYAGSTLLEANDNWGQDGVMSAIQLQTIFNQVGAFAFPTGSADSALAITLPPGSYSAQVTSQALTQGVALIEIYLVP